MAAAVTSTPASRLLRPKLFLSSTSDPPPLIIIRSPPIRISHGALRLPSPASSGSTRSTPIRCRPNRSGDSNSPLNCGSEFYNRREGHWFVVMDKPGGEGASRQEMVDCYVQTLAGVVGSKEEAKKKIYMVLCEGDFGFGCVIDEETKEKIRGLAGVRFVFHDPYAETGIHKLKYSAQMSLGRAPIGRVEQKKEIEEVIESLESIESRFMAHKALWEEVGDSLQDSDIHRIEQAERAIESLSSALRAIWSLRNAESRMLAITNEKLDGLSWRVRGLMMNLPTKEAYTLSPNIYECGPTDKASY